MGFVAARELIKLQDAVIEDIGERTDVWPIYFHKPSGKWKYTDYVVMRKPEHWTDFKKLIQDALDNTPEMVRETRIKSIEPWTVIMPNNPLGFPIMVVAHDADR